MWLQIPICSISEHWKDVMPLTITFQCLRYGAHTSNTFTGSNFVILLPSVVRESRSSDKEGCSGTKMPPPPAVLSECSSD